MPGAASLGWDGPQKTTFANSPLCTKYPQDGGESAVRKVEVRPYVAPGLQEVLDITAKAVWLKINTGRPQIGDWSWLGEMLAARNGAGNK